MLSKSESVALVKRTQRKSVNRTDKIMKSNENVSLSLRFQNKYKKMKRRLLIYLLKIVIYYW